MHDIAHIEVAIRNAYDRVLSAYWQGMEHWLFDNSSPVIVPLLQRKSGKVIDVNAGGRELIAAARRRLRGRSGEDPNKILPELPFGFWRHLTNAAHEKTLWIPYLRHAFPGKTDRGKIEESLVIINIVRNRVSHHEPLFMAKHRRQVLDAHEASMQLAELLLPQLAQHLRKTTTVRRVLGERPAARA